MTVPAADDAIVELEQEVIGAMLAGGDHRQVLAALDDDHIAEPVHRQIIEAIRIALDRYGTSALPTVARLIPLETQTAFKTSTGMELGSYLASMVANTSMSRITLPRGIRAVARQWARREIGQEAAAAAEAAKDPTADPAHLIRTLMGRADEIGASIRQAHRVKTRMSMDEAIDLSISEARAAQERKGLVGITTGLIDLDRAIGGFQRRDLNVIAARPAMGKTTLAVALARAAAQAGHGVGMFTLEMDNAKIGARFASDIAHLGGHRVPYQDIIRGSFDSEQETRIAEARTAYGDLGICLEDQSGLNMAAIRIKTEAMLEDAERAGRPLHLLLVDHLGKIRPSTRYAGNRNNEIGEITDGMKELAREYELAVVLLSQLSRGVESREDKRPGLMDLRDSGNIEQDADTVMFLYREAYYLEQRRPENMDQRIEWEADLSACRNKAELIIGKQRNGPTCTIDLFMDVACSAVRNAARSF